MNALLREGSRPRGENLGRLDQDHVLNTASHRSVEPSGTSIVADTNIDAFSAPHSGFEEDHNRVTKCPNDVKSKAGNGRRAEQSNEIIGNVMQRIPSGSSPDFCTGARP